MQIISLSHESFPCCNSFLGEPSAVFPGDAKTYFLPQTPAGNPSQAKGQLLPILGSTALMYTLVG